MKKPKARVCTRGTNTLSFALAYRFLTQHADSCNSTVLQRKFRALCLEMCGFDIRVCSFCMFLPAQIILHPAHAEALLQVSYIYIGSLFLTSSLWVLFCFALLSRVYVYRRYMNGYVHVHVCACLYTCGGQKLASDVFLDLCPFH